MSQNITVAVRVRPLSQKEVDRGAFACLEVADGEEINCIDPDDKQLESLGGAKVTDYLRLDKTKDRSYRFDCAIAPEVSQSDAFEKTLQSLIPDVLSGKNACCFAYGATGSGKTFTMTGNQQMPGLIPQGVDALFQQSDIQVSMQYVEIYNEQIKDLLQPSNNDHLDVREAPGKGTFVAGAANVEVSSRDDVEALLEAGNAYRTTESTQLNMVSSRSHAVLQLRIQLGEKKGKLSLIDLAGSERASKTGVMSSTNNIGRGGTNNNTKRLNEGANINRSLLSLANCISALADQAKKGNGGANNTAHIPYRDSKLTRLLKDSLGGRCRTMMIANVSPSSDQFDETLNTLKYADRAKRIKTKKSKSPSKLRQNTGSFAPVPPPRPAGDKQVAAAKRAAERSAAAQLEGARSAADRHLARMNAGRVEKERIEKGTALQRGGTGVIGEEPSARKPRQEALARINRAISSDRPTGGVSHRPALVKGASKEEVAAATVQRHARGRLARAKTQHLKAGDLLAARRLDPRVGNAIAKRAAMSEMAGDVPANSPSRQIATRRVPAGGGLPAVRARKEPPKAVQTPRVEQKILRVDFMGSGSPLPGLR